MESLPPTGQLPPLPSFDFVRAAVVPPSSSLGPIIESREPRREVPAWSLALIAACLVLGFMVRWGLLERSERFAESARAERAKTAVTMLESRQADLGQVMADPKTKLIELAPTGRSTGIKHIVIAWNIAQHRAIVFCEDLPPLAEGSKYQLWMSDGNSAATRCGQFDAVAGNTMYAIDLPAGAAANVTVSITAGALENNIARSGDVIFRGAAR